MKKAKIKASTLTKIFNFLKKEKGEAIPRNHLYLTEPIPFEIAKENLSVTKFQNGEPIPEAKTKEEWVHFAKEKVPAFMRYGKHFHYNHYAVTDERSICPPGWRVTTYEDLIFILYRRLYKTFPLVGERFSTNGKVFQAGSAGFYWSSEVSHNSYDWASILSFGSYSAGLSSGEREHGYSVRCVRDKK